MLEVPKRTEEVWGTQADSSSRVFPPQQVGRTSQPVAVGSRTRFGVTTKPPHDGNQTRCLKWKRRRWWKPLLSCSCAPVRYEIPGEGEGTKKQYVIEEQP